MELNTADSNGGTRLNVSPTEALHLIASLAGMVEAYQRTGHEQTILDAAILVEGPGRAYPHKVLFTISEKGT